MEKVYILSCLTLDQIKSQIDNSGTCCLRISVDKKDAIKKSHMGMGCKIYEMTIENLEDRDVS